MTQDPLRIGDAARLLGITEDHLRDLTPRGKERIPCSRTPGGHRLFDAATMAEIKELGLDAWVRKHEDELAAPPGVLCRRTHCTITSGIVVIDFGNALVAGFGLGVKLGRVADAPPTPGTFNLSTDNISWGHLDNIALFLDPLVLDPAWSDEDRTEAITSYTRSTTALLGGQVTVDSPPVVQVLPIVDLRVIRAAYESDGIVSPLVDLNPQGIIERAKLRIPPGESWRVIISVPNRSVNPEGKAYEGYVYVWTGLIQITQRNQFEESEWEAIRSRMRASEGDIDFAAKQAEAEKRFPNIDWKGLQKQLRPEAQRVVDKSPVTPAEGAGGYYLGDPKD